MKSRLRPRKTLGLRRKFSQAVVIPQPVVRGVHELPNSNLVLPTEPLSQPLRRVGVNCRVGRADLSEMEIVRPSG